MTTPCEHGVLDYEQCARCRGVATAPPLLIALTSPAMGAGKSEVARHLVERHGFLPLKFAGVLKAMTVTFLRDGLGLADDVIDEMIEGRLKEAPIDGLGKAGFEVTPRRLMQTLGTEWGRDCIRTDLWTSLVRQRAIAHLALGRSVVIDDLRFQNELELVHELGGTAYRVTRPGIADATGHPSEGALAAEPLEEIPNSGTIDDLRRLTDGIVAIARARKSRET